MYLTSKDDFFAAIAGQTVDFDTGSGLVKLRGLTVAEVKAMQARQTDNGIDTLPLLVAHGLVEPELSESDVQRVADSGAFSVVSAIAQRVMALSGITDDARKREALDS